jgi:hypothetical protein
MFCCFVCQKAKSVEKIGLKRAFKMPLITFEQVTQMLPRLQRNLMFLSTLFIIAGFIFMNLLGKPMSGSSTLMLPRRRCCATGSNTEVTLHIPSTRGLFFGRLNESLGQNHLPSGIEDSSNDILKFDWANLRGWI